MPTIQVLVKAPETSPLRQLDISRVGQFLLELTNPVSIPVQRILISPNADSMGMTTTSMRTPQRDPKQLATIEPLQTQTQ
mmetsp:Transcript_1397/g.4197  ORF Transcript_1397/g.4197 Transcript_1397/m.4197 type:complete len:80 (+) Transcript_1397:2631-2870(+)